MQSEIAKISIHDDLTAYAVNIVDATRNKAEIFTAPPKGNAKRDR